jgi:CIC family chloride channel protein
VQSLLRKLEQLLAGVHAFARQHWQGALRIREKLRVSEEAFHLVLAGGVGVIGGLTNVGFHLCMNVSQRLFLHRTGDPAILAQDSTEWQRLLIPAVGGLLAGMVLYWGLRLVGKQGSSDYLEVIVASDGRLPMRTGFVKALSSLLSIGSGASIGREGAIVEMAAMLASKWGQLAHWQPYRLRLLVACGAASGIAAAYNAPIAGAVFAALIVLGNFSMNLFAPLVFSSVIATMVSRSFFGIAPLYVVPPFDVPSLTKLPWFVILGVLSGMVGAALLKMLDWSKGAFRKIPVPVYVRLLLGGLIVGLITLGYPKVWGNGYEITNEILKQAAQPRHELPLFLVSLAGLFCAKLISTLSSFGSGAVGGVFTPTLFLGAAFGSLLGNLLHLLGLGVDLPTGAFALVGMGSMLAATTRSPLLAMIMVFEISLNYSVMPPLMLACVVSTLVARRFHPESIYTQPLRDKGLQVDRESLRPGSATEQTVGDLMRAPIPPVRETATLQEIAERFLASPNNFLPVVDAKYQLIGVVALQDLKEYLNAGAEMSAVIAYDVMRPAPACVTPGQLLLDTLPIMLASEQRNVPVVNSLTENRLVGAVLRAEVLGLLSQAIAARTGATSPPELS